jgi:hypothetical protein
MKTHLNDGQLRASLDGELDADETHHLENCPACRARLEQMHGRSWLVNTKLSSLASENIKVPPARLALARFRNHSVQKEEKPMIQKLFRSRFVRFVTVIILALAAVIAIPTTRAWAAEFLGLFRVESVTVLPIDYTGLEKLNTDAAFGDQVRDLLSSSVSVQQQPSDPQEVSNVGEASQQAGFTVRMPSAAPAPSQIIVQGGAAFEFSIDLQKAQALLDEAGRSDLVLPSSLDSEKVSVIIPSGISAAFNECPDLLTTDEDTLQGEGSNGRNYPNCMILAEIPSPTVTTPPDLDIAKLATIALEFTGMTPEEAQAFTSTVDWTSSLVLPIPKNAATYEQVQVDGVTGSLIQRPSDDAPRYLLVWVKDGIVYTLGGLGVAPENILDIANSMN